MIYLIPQLIGYCGVIISATVAYHSKRYENLFNKIAYAFFALFVVSSFCGLIF